MLHISVYITFTYIYNSFTTHVPFPRHGFSKATCIRGALEAPSHAAIDAAGLAPGGVHALEAVRLEAGELLGAFPGRRTLAENHGISSKSDTTKPWCLN